MCIYGGLKSKVTSKRVSLTPGARGRRRMGKTLKFLLQILKEKEKEWPPNREARIALTPGLSP